VKAPKGFGKNYFSLAAIQAHVSTVQLSQTSVRITSHHFDILDYSDEVQEDDDPNELLLSTVTYLPKKSSRPSPRGRTCHCNVHFKHKAICHIQRFDIPKLFILPFEFSNSTTSPP